MLGGWQRAWQNQANQTLCADPSSPHIKDSRERSSASSAFHCSRLLLGIMCFFGPGTVITSLLLSFSPPDTFETGKEPVAPSSDVDSRVEVGSNEVPMCCFCTKVYFSGIHIFVNFLFILTVFTQYIHFFNHYIEKIFPCYILKSKTFFEEDYFTLSVLLGPRLVFSREKIEKNIYCSCKLTTTCNHKCLHFNFT